MRAGLPVEINPSLGSGFKVMDWPEYFGRFKTSPEFPECLACGGRRTKEHFFVQARAARGGRPRWAMCGVVAQGPRAPLLAGYATQAHAPTFGRAYDPACLTPAPASQIDTSASVPRAPRLQTHPQTWYRGKRFWESEAYCLDCAFFSYRGYRDPDFETPEQFEKRRWTELVAEHAAAGQA